MFNFHIKKQLSKTFFLDVNFQANSGEITTLIGKSGAGKTSILDAIAGLIPLDAGWIKTDQKDYTQLPVHLRQFGYVKQNSVLFPHLTILENMTYSSKKVDKKLEAYLDVFELSPHLYKRSAELSGGEAKRVAIVRTLMSEPQLLLLDEAFSALDPALRHKIRSYLKEQLQIPIILVTHDLAEAQEMSDYILAIDEGKIVEQHLPEKQEVQFSIAILAGGEGTRLGSCQKAFLRFENQTFLERMLHQMSTFDDVMISIRDKALYEAFPYQTHIDETTRIGPMGGLYTCLKQCRHEYLFICAVDMPHFKKELMLFIAEFISSDYDAFVIKSNDKVHPLCGIYKKTALPHIASMIDERNHRLTDLLARINTKYIPLAYSCFDEQVMINVNTKADLIRIKAPTVFCVSGIKNSGKTTLITKLIQAFKTEGYRIGVIKHDGHEFEIDHKGTDTYQHRAAGSDTTLIYSETQFALIKDQQQSKVEQLLKFFTDVDLVIIEGLKNSPYPKIELVLEEPVCDAHHLIAVATDGDYRHPAVPTFKRSDITGLVTRIKRKVLKEDER